MMDVTVKAFLANSDGSTEVRRLPLTLVGPSTISGLYERLKSQIAGSFPDLKDKSFIISWRDSDGDYVLVSSDDELLEALSEMENRQLKLYLTEAPSEIQADVTAAMFPGKSLRARPQGPWMRVSEADKSDLSVKDEKGWKTALRDLVPTAHRRWAKEHIRVWRQEHLDNGSVTGSSDGQRGQKITAEEAGVPQEYITYLDIQVFRFHKVWAQEKPGKAQPEFEKVKETVPEPFQNWVRWYLKKTFGPNRTPQFKKIKEEKEEKAAKKEKDEGKKKKEDERLKKEAKAWKKEWKERLKEMREAVPKKQRAWSKDFISWWRQQRLTEAERSRYATTSSSSSSSSSDSNDEKKQKAISKPDLNDVPEHYPRWLDLFLTQWHACQGDSLPEEDVKKASAELKEIDDEQVSREYRKWARFYIIRVLCRRKKYRQQSNEVTTWRQYHLWLLEFQKRWVADQDAASASNSEGEDASESQVEPRGGVVLQRLQAIIDSGTEYELEMPVPPTSRPPAEFRYWALDIIQKWDGQTIGQGLPDSIAPLDNETKDIPPGVLHWLMKVTARTQLKKVRAELRGAAADGAKDTKASDGKKKSFFGKKKDSDESDKKKKAETDDEGKKKKDHDSGSKSEGKDKKEKKASKDEEKKKKADKKSEEKKEEEKDGEDKGKDSPKKKKEKEEKDEEKKKKADKKSEAKREEEKDGEGKGKDSPKKKREKEDSDKKTGEKDDKKKKSEKEEKVKSETNQDSVAKKDDKKEDKGAKGDSGDRKKKEVKTSDKKKAEDRNEHKEPKDKSVEATD